MTDSTPSCSDVVQRLLELPDDLSRDQVQVVLSDELALTLLSDEDDPMRQLVMGYVINQSSYFGADVVETAQTLMASLETGTSGGMLTLTPSVTGPDGSPEPAPPGDVDDLKRMLQLFVPGITITRSKA
ncbi:MAG TPA: hypothetical protein VGH44_01700 [Candidatus Saccharimonadia bacterium]|jgi:hypothetical protein